VKCRTFFDRRWQ